MPTATATIKPAALPAAISTLLMVLIAACAFLCTAGILDPTQTPRLLALSAVNLSLAIVLSANGQSPLIWHPGDLFLLGYLVIAGLSLTGAPNLSEGLFAWIKTANCVSFYFLYKAAVSRCPGLIKQTFFFLSAAGVMLALVGIGQDMGLSFLDMPGTGGVRGTMGNRNLFASAVFMTFPFMAVTASKTSSRVKKAATIGIFLMFWAMGISICRTVWLAMILSGAFLSVLHWWRSQRAEKGSRPKYREYLAGWAPWAIGLLMMGLLFMTCRIICDGSLAERMVSVVSIEERFSVWDKTLNMISDRGIVGVGLGQWRIFFPACSGRAIVEMIDGSRVESWYQRPHNEWLGLFAEAGIGGLVCYLSWWGFLVLGACRRFVNHPDKSRFGRTGWLLFGLTGYTVISCFSFPGEQTFHAICVMTMAGSLVPVTEHYSLTEGLRLKRALCVGILALISSLGIGLSAARMHAETQARSALTAYHAAKWPEVVFHLDRIPSSVYTLDPAGVPLAWYRGVARFNMGDVSHAMPDFQEAIMRHPFFVHAHHNLGVCHAVLGQVDQARQCFLKSLAIDSDFEPGRRHLERLNRREAQTGKNE